MRHAFGLIAASLIAAIAIAGIWYFTASPHASHATTQSAATRPADPPAPPSTGRLAARDTGKDSARDDIPVTAALSGKPPAPPVLLQQKPACANPNALGVSRVVVIDTTGGPGFGFEQFKQFDFLTDKEVVLTFDDGPWPTHTPAVLKALDDECAKAVFFPIGKHATYHPEILKQVLAAGHTVGSHTWSHANLNGKKMTDQLAVDELEKGFSAVKMALGSDPAPFFRFPQLQNNPAAVTYLGTRNVAMFSCDLDSFDFKAANADQIVNTVMTKLEKRGKGIILMHDFQKHTAEAMPTLLQRLKAGGYKIVLMKAKATLATLPDYDASLIKDLKLPAVSSRPIGSVVQTVAQ